MVASPIRWGSPSAKATAFMLIENIEIKAGNVGGNRPHHCSKPLGPPRPSP